MPVGTPAAAPGGGTPPRPHRCPWRVAETFAPRLAAPAGWDTQRMTRVISNRSS